MASEQYDQCLRTFVQAQNASNEKGEDHLNFGVLAANAVRTYFVVANQYLEGRHIYLGSDKKTQQEVAVPLGKQTAAVHQELSLSQRKTVTLTVEPEHVRAIKLMSRHFGLSLADFFANALALYATLKPATLEGKCVYVCENGRIVEKIKVL